MRSRESSERGAPLRRLAAALAVTTLALAACGGAASGTSPSPVVKATVAPATSAAATPAPTATPAPKVVVNIEAGENADGSYYLKSDQIAVAAGKVTFTFTNKGKLTHEVMVYPIQDITTLLALHRKDQKADEEALLKGLAGMAEDIDAGKSSTFDATLTPGFYELACHARAKNPDGTGTTHFDKGQFLTLAVTGAGGPAASIATAASAINVTMQDGANGSWVFIPDHLVATAGDVAFKVTNNMKVEHDFVVSPLGDVSAEIATGLKTGADIDLDAPAVPVFEDLGAGKTDSKTIKLTPGTYIMACYMVSKNADGTSFLHRDMGQRIVFIVK